MYRIVSFIVLFTFVGTTLYFYTLNSHFVMSMSENDHSHHHSLKEVPETAPAPAISGSVGQEAGQWLVELETENFHFSRDDSVLHPEIMEGHAHLYVNDDQEARIYANTYNLGHLEEGTHQIKVVLVSHDHQTLVKGGQEISFEEVIKVP